MSEHSFRCSQCGDLGRPFHETRQSVDKNIIFAVIARFVINYIMFTWQLFESYVLNTLFKAGRLRNIKGDIALVTGAGSGLGRALSIELAHRGAIVVVCDTDENTAGETAQLIRAEGNIAYVFSCDVSSPKSVKSMASAVREKVGRVSILVNSADCKGRLNELSDEAVQNYFNINTLAHFWTTRAFLPAMQQANHGYILTVSSVAGLAGVPRRPEYSASKFAACGFAESIAAELRADGFTGIRSTIVCPAVTSTESIEAATNREDQPQLNEIAQTAIDAMLLSEGYVILPRLSRLSALSKFLLPRPW